MIRKIVLTVLILIVLGFSTYVFLWPFDYRVRFEAKTYPGVVGQTLQTWSEGLNRIHPAGPNGPFSSIEREASRLYRFKQVLKEGPDGRERVYHWSVQWNSDSTSRVIVQVSELGNRVGNRLAIPFRKTEFEQEVQKRVLDYYGKLNEHLQNFQVKVEEVEDLASTYTAYISVACKQNEKAAYMMRDYPYLTNMMITHDIETNGIPFVEITDWNEAEDSIYFNFCYPIIRSEKLPIGTELKYKRFFGGRALKATYNGNYIFSDRAWYALRKAAKDRGLSFSPQPLEFFYNNPNFGGDDREWKAEIFLPLRDTD